MELTETENRLRALFLPVFGLDSVEKIDPEDSLVRDLGAESLDFVEIVYLIESNYDISLKTDELVAGGVDETVDSFFADDTLTAEGAELLKDKFPYNDHRLQEGMSKVDIFSMLTVRDLANIILMKAEDSDA